MRHIAWTRLTAGVLTGGSLLLVFTGCGGSSDKFKNEPRPPVTTQLTGVITSDRVTVSPDRLPQAKPGQEEEATKELDTPIILLISNQTEESHTVTLAGKDLRGNPIEARTPPINPLDTAQIQQSLPPGTYEVKAGSEKAVDPSQMIAAAKLTIGRNRQTSSDDLLLP